MGCRCRCRSGQRLASGMHASNAQRESRFSRLPCIALSGRRGCGAARGERSLDLSKCFVHSYSGSDRKVQAAYRSWHRQTDSLRCISLMKRIREPGRLASENQAITNLILHFPVGLLSEFREHPEAPSRHGSLQRFPVVHDFPPEMGPVIEPRTLQLPILQLESKRPHQPQFCVDGNTGPSYIPSVLRDLRLEKDDMQPRFNDTQPSGLRLETIFFCIGIQCLPAAQDHPRKVWSDQFPDGDTRCSSSLPHQVV
jgi:hypothetical protein